MTSMHWAKTGRESTRRPTSTGGGADRRGAIGPGSSVWPGVVIRADNGPIVIGARTSIQDGAVIHTQSENQTRIGADCVIGHLAHLEGCVLEDLVLVGAGAVVLEGVVCRSGSLVGAGAVVSPGTEVPSGAMALGVRPVSDPGR